MTIQLKQLAYDKGQRRCDLLCILLYSIRIHLDHNAY